jgi:Low psii accumulation1 / Rep27
MNRQVNREQYQKLKAEAKAPYRGLRKFIYGAFAASGFIGAVIFLAQILAGKDINSAVPNFFLQVGVVAVMFWLFKLDQPKNNKK